MPQVSTEQNPGWAWLSLAVFAIAGIGLFFIPAFIIRPFRHQGPQALEVALALRHYAPWGTLVAALICVVLTLSLWAASTRWTRVTLVVIMLPVLFSAVMARMNYFEWMFHPVLNPAFEAEAQSKLDTGEMILAIRFGADARAYPIREMAYHHIVNDVVGGVPVAVTY
jgi:hypothetical protein